MALVLRLPNVLRKKADKPGGLTPQEAIGRAQAALAAFCDAYREWAEADVQRLKAASTGLHSDPEERERHIREMYRIAHEMRGQAATFGFPLMSEISNSLCHFIETITRATPRDLQILNLHVNALRAVLAENAEQTGDRLARDLVASLRELSGPKRNWKS